eukprot:TRINITY_DN13846_c0_g1_i1.p1 TRINITY_DN13846_c0_g1~~TRINITY_DN13846_c0_g1_i1.p1  ORF type:complete len:326 (+),score=81.62 TRINITY_DN13846_c0_g1_i1:123-1100(+)
MSYPPQQMYYPPTWCGCPYVQDYGHACTQLCGCSGACQYPMGPPVDYYQGGYYSYQYPSYGGYGYGQVVGEAVQEHEKYESEKMSSEEGSSHGSEVQGDGKPKTAKAQLLGILNRFTEVKYKENYTAVQRLIETEDLDPTMLADIVHDQAVVMPSFAPLYARLCNDLCENLGLPNATSKKELMVNSPFRRALLKKCQNQFEEVVQSCKDGSAKLIDKQKEKEILSFICALHVCGVVGTNTILMCINSLITTSATSIQDLSKTDSIYVDLLVHVLGLVSKSLASKAPLKPRVDRVYTDLEDLSHKVSTRQKFLLQNLIEKRPQSEQ